MNSVYGVLISILEDSRKEVWVFLHIWSLTVNEFYPQATWKEVPAEKLF